MEDKEKQIKEMAKDLRDTHIHIYALEETLAEKLISKGWIKPNKNSIVLSKKDYEEYKRVVDGKAIMVENITDLNRLVQFPIEYDNKFFDDIADFGNYVEEQAHKEMAEKILNKFDDIQENLSKKIKQLKEPFNYVSMTSKEKEGYKDGILAAKSIVASFKSQLAKQFNINIKD